MKTPHPGLISVILSTYNQPAWLEKVLWGYAAQQDRRFEVVVADDGSGPETRELIARLAPQLGVPVHHVWQEDDGFRKCRILNLAALAAQGDYLIFSDGDCIPTPDFVATHRRVARPARYVTGILLRLDLAASDRITVEDVRAGRTASYRWLRSIGVPRSTRLLRHASPRWLAGVADYFSESSNPFNGCNSSVWRSDLEAVNGFEERMTYGAEDTEFGYRLCLTGVLPLCVRNRAPLLHLDHGRPYHSPADFIANEPIIQEVKSGSRRRALQGLEGHVKASGRVGG
jgi:glycosyltransferase involved in cell wall biosynthesis